VPLAGPAVADPEADVLIERYFVREQISTVRHDVRQCVRSAGLSDERLEGFVLSVNEIVTNVVLHAGGAGRLRVWTAAGSVHCEVSDHGPGIPRRYLSGELLPAAFEPGGRGIWLAHRLCDSVRVRTSSSGSTVLLSVSLSRRSGTGNAAAAVLAP